MSQVFKLFKLQFDEKYDILKTGNWKKMVGAIIKYIVIIGLLTFGFYTVFLKLVLLGLANNEELLSIVLLVTQAISLLFATGHTIKILFQNKDNELLMSLPVSPNQVFVSKIILSYVQEVITSAIICLPLLLSLGMLGGTVLEYSAFYYIMLPLNMLILPILPLALALFIAIPINMLLKFLKKHILVSTIAIVLFVIAMIIVYSNLLKGVAENFNIADKQIETIKNINLGIQNFGSKNFVFIYYVQGMLGINKIYFVGLYLLISGALFVGALFTVRPFFFRIAMSNLEHSEDKTKTGKFKKDKPLVSCLKAEFHKVFRSSGDIFNNFLFVILMPVVVVIYDNLLLDLVVNQVGKQMINGAHVLIVAVFATLANIYSASAISKEGSNFYLIKTMPIDYYTQTLAKILFNAIFSVGAILITGFVTMLYMNFWIVLFTTLICIFISLGHIFYSIDVDLKNPKLDWYDSSDIDRLNNNTSKCIAMGLLLAVISGFLIMSLSTTNLGIWSFVILLVLSIAFCLYKAYILTLRIYYQYDKLEP